MIIFLRTLTKYLNSKLEDISQSKEQKKTNLLFETIQSIENGSNRITGWSLSVVGGSLLVIMNENYIQPNDIFKLFYILFFCGWILIAISIYYSKKIAGRKMAATLIRNDIENLKDILLKINSHYSNQLKFFNFALMTFGLWLIFYLIWWIFGECISYLISK